MKENSRDLIKQSSLENITEEINSLEGSAKRNHTLVKYTLFSSFAALGGGLFSSNQYQSNIVAFLSALSFSVGTFFVAPYFAYLRDRCHDKIKGLKNIQQTLHKK